MPKTGKTAGPAVSEQTGPVTVDVIRKSKERAKVQGMLERRIRLKLEREKLDGEIKSLDADLQIAFMENDLKSILHDGFATVMVESAGQTRLDKQKLQEELVKRKVKLEVLEAAFAAATLKGQPYTCIQVRKEKGGEGE